jgi:hypothetical protein
VPSADGKRVELHVETRYRGDRAESARHRLRSRRLEQLANEFADFYRKQYGELQVATATTVSEDEVENTLTYREHYQLDGVWSGDVGGSRRLSSYAEALSFDARLPESMARTEPMRLSRPSSLRHEVRIELPTGWVLSDLPEKKTVTSAPVNYSRTLSQEGNTVSLVHAMDISSDHVDSTHVADYVAKLRQVREALGMRLSLGMPAQLRSGERDQRLKNLLQGIMESSSDEGK